MRVLHCYATILSIGPSCAPRRKPLELHRKRADYQAVYQYLALAHSWAVSTTGAIVILHGVSGSDKSTQASQLVERLGAIQLRSDVERKRMFDLMPGRRFPLHLEQGTYTEDATKQTYDHMASITRMIVEAGFIAIVDASFLKHSQRDQFKQLAQDCGVPISFLSCEEPERALRERIRRRIENNKDASGANLAY